MAHHPPGLSSFRWGNQGLGPGGFCLSLEWKGCGSRLGSQLRVLPALPSMCRQGAQPYAPPRATPTGCPDGTLGPSSTSLLSEEHYHGEGSQGGRWDQCLVGTEARAELPDEQQQRVQPWVPWCPPRPPSWPLPFLPDVLWPGGLFGPGSQPGLLLHRQLSPPECSPAVGTAVLRQPGLPNQWVPAGRRPHFPGQGSRARLAPGSEDRGVWEEGLPSTLPQPRSPRVWLP